MDIRKLKLSSVLSLIHIFPPAVGRLLIQMQPRPSGDVKQDRPADRIKGLLAVVVPAFGFLRVGERDAKFFQDVYKRQPLHDSWYLSWLSLKYPFTA